MLPEPVNVHFFLGTAILDDLNMVRKASRPSRSPIQVDATIEWLDLSRPSVQGPGRPDLMKLRVMDRENLHTAW